MKKSKIILLFLFLLALFWCAGESSPFDFQQKAYLRDDIRDRIFIYTYNWNPSCWDIRQHWRQLMNTEWRTTWSYYFLSWASVPAYKINVATKFYDWQVIMEDYQDDYNFVYSIGHWWLANWHEALIDYRGTGSLDCPK